jgi:hypothetical protein
MNACERFETEGLARFVAGLPLDPHFEACTECRSAQGRYQAVASALHQAKDAYSPKGNWEAKVWAAIQRGEGARRRSGLGVLLGLGASLAALALFFVTSAGGPGVLALTTNRIERVTAVVIRGPSAGGDVQSAAPGDVLHLVVTVPHGKLGDVRVYRGADELVFQCVKSAACLKSKEGLEARVTLERAGIYRTVIIAADKALPLATGSLDADYAAAMRAGSAQESAPIEVL